MEYMTTVLGSFGAEKYNELACGKVLELKLEPNNPTDEKAIAVYLDGSPVGYVANSKQTLLPNTTSANNLNPYLRHKKVKETRCLLIEEKAYCSAKGSVQKRYLAKVFFVPVRAEEKKAKDKVVEYVSTGSTVKSPRSVDLRKRIKEAHDKGVPAEFDVIVKREGDSGLYKYKMYEEGQQKPCGEIKPAKGDPMEKWFNTNTELRGKTTGEVKVATDGQGGASISIKVVYSARSKAELNSDIDAAIGRCAGQEDALQDKVEYMTEVGVERGCIKRVLAEMHIDSGDPRIPSKPERPYRSKTSTLNDAIIAFMLHKPIRFIGAKGAGKNTIIETICWLLNQPMLRVQGSVELDKMDVMGAPQLEDGRTTFQLSPVMCALRDGCTVVIDEANLIRPDVLGILHSATDNARSVLVPGYGDVALAPSSSIVYTMNEGYTGTGDMNEATVDRALLFELEPEVKLSSILTGYPTDQVTICQKISDQIRKAVADGTLGADCITIRGYIDALDLAKQGMPLKRALIHGIEKAQEITWRKAVEEIINTNC